MMALQKMNLYWLVEKAVQGTEKVHGMNKEWLAKIDG